VGLHGPSPGRERRRQGGGRARPPRNEPSCVAATHRDLAALVREGGFREDLYYRLSVLPVRLPPLRERPEDIVPLVEHFARVHGAARGVTFDADALDLLAREPWPGNVRQLQNLVEHVVLLSEQARVTSNEVRRALATQGGAAPAFSPPVSGVVAVDPSQPGDHTLDGTRRDAERAALRNALERAGGNRTQAARILGVSRRTFYNKLAELGLE
jgi:two-component system response regulator AtoC